MLKLLNVTHRNLRRLHESGSAKGVKPEAAGKLRKMFAYQTAMDDAEELRALGTWKAHTLTAGDRQGTWSLTVTRNHRLTFRVDTAEDEIYDVNLEDYH